MKRPLEWPNTTCENPTKSVTTLVSFLTQPAAEVQPHMSWHVAWVQAWVEGSAMTYEKRLTNRSVELLRAFRNWRGTVHAYLTYKCNTASTVIRTPPLLTICRCHVPYVMECLVWQCTICVCNFPWQLAASISHSYQTQMHYQLFLFFLFWQSTSLFYLIMPKLQKVFCLGRICIIQWSES